MAMNASVEHHPITTTPVTAEYEVITKLLNPDLWPHLLTEVDTVISPDDWFHERYRCIHKALNRLRASGAHDWNAAVVIEELNIYGELNAAGGAEYVETLANNASGSHQSWYLTQIKRLSQQRQLIALNHEAQTELQAGRAPEEVAAWHTQRLSRISAETRSEGVIETSSLLSGVVQKIQTASLAPDQPPGITTGLIGFDNLTDGFHPRRVYLLGGLPGVGKTAFAVQSLLSAAAQHPGQVLIASLEVVAEELMMRMLAFLARVDYRKLQRGHLSDGQWATLNQACVWLREHPIGIVNHTRLTPALLAAECERHKNRNGGLKFLVVDSLQLMTPDDTSGNEFLDIGNTLWAVREMTLALDLSTLMLSSITRPDTHRRPVLRDYWGGSKIESHGDGCGFLHNPNPNDLYDPGQVHLTGTQAPIELELLLLKHRMGPVGMTRLLFDGSLQRFSDAAAPSYAQTYQSTSQNFRDHWAVDNG